MELCGVILVMEHKNYNLVNVYHVVLIVRVVILMDIATIVMDHPLNIIYLLMVKIVNNVILKIVFIVFNI